MTIYWNSVGGERDFSEASLHPALLNNVSYWFLLQGLCREPLQSICGNKSLSFNGFGRSKKFGVLSPSFVYRIDNEPEFAYRCLITLLTQPLNALLGTCILRYQCIPPSHKIQPVKLVNPSTPTHFEALPLTRSEQVLACCAIAREKLEAGDYDAGCAALEPWWSLGQWPCQAGLSNSAAAELLLTAGTLSGWVASSQRIPGGRKPAEALLNGSIAMFEQLGETKRAAEGRIELACCYYHQGAFDLSRQTVQYALQSLSNDVANCEALA